MHADTALKRMEMLPELARAGKRVNGLFRLLTCRPLWMAGLDRIKRNKGAETPGVDGQVVGTLGLGEIESAIGHITAGSYSPKPVRRIYIPKANGKLRPLGIPTAMDRLVQEVVRSVLSQIYEPIFSGHSHGFRPKRSCHTALDHIKYEWTGVKWFVEVDVKGYFDNINHSILLDMLSKRIDDDKFIALISKMLKSGFLDQWRYNETYSGTPQGGVISPLLANIYLHEFDRFMEERIRCFNKGQRRAKNPEYNSLGVQTYKLRARISKLRAADRNEEAAILMEEHDKRRSKMVTLPSKNPLDPNFKRLRYVRYADDFLIGVIGSKAEAREAMDAVKDFLAVNLKLETSTEKTGVFKASVGVQFLGYGVRAYVDDRRIVKHGKDGYAGTMRSLSGQIQLRIPREKIHAFVSRKGYGHYDFCKSMHRGALIHCDDVEIASIYNAEFRGFANYYAMAYAAKQDLAKLQLIWQTSLYLTLAAKHRSTVNTMVRRYKIRPGQHVVWQVEKGERVQVKVWDLKDLDTSSSPSWTVDIRSKALRMSYTRTRYVDRMLARTCSACGSSERAFEIHHVNPLRNASRSKLGVKLSGRARKTVVLCTECHRHLHAGRLPDVRNTVDEGGEPDDGKLSSPVRWEGEGRPQ